MMPWEDRGEQGANKLIENREINFHSSHKSKPGHLKLCAYPWMSCHSVNSAREGGGHSNKKMPICVRWVSKNIDCTSVLTLFLNIWKLVFATKMTLYSCL